MAGPAREIGGVRGAGQTEEEGAAHVDDDDADEDLADGVRDGNTRVFGLGGGYGDGFDTCVEGGAEDEDRGDAAEAIGEGAGVVPVLESNGVGTFDTSGDVTILGSVQVRKHVGASQTNTMLKMKYATSPISLMSASQNSASPKVSTPRSWKPKNANCLPCQQQPQTRSPHYTPA